METHHHEWILTNRMGGYALGTGNLINQRKYHGLLIKSDKKFNRVHLVSGMEEKVEWRGEVFYLDSNNYSNCIYPEGFLHLVKPWLKPYPIFLYSALPHQNDILVRKELMMDEDSNTVLVKYTNLGHHRLHFEFRPKYTLCPHHELNHPGSLESVNFDTRIESSGECTLFSALRQDNGICVFGALLQGEVSDARSEYKNVFYPWEVMSGYPGIGDQISLFNLVFDLRIGASTSILFSDSPIEDPMAMVKKIQSRYADLPKPLDYPAQPDENDELLNNLDYNDNFQFKHDEYLQILKASLLDFLANDDIVAGYPFYGAWGRDTMVVLNSLLKTEECLDTVDCILNKYRQNIDNGLIPNMMPESGRPANYDSIDATLWFIILLWKMANRRADATYWKDRIALAEEILIAILNNFTYKFDVRRDGLIELHEDFAHGTWMDVRVDGKPITPRSGAPVEINALWYNALCCYADMCNCYAKITDSPNSALMQLLEMKDKVLVSFSKFWKDGYLADRLSGDDPVMEIRPNAIIALSLPWPLLDQDKLAQVFEKAYHELYTNYGIRTLSPKDIRFRKKYYGTQRERDMSYHNGSVWAWLLGPFCGLYVKAYRGRKKDTEIKDALESFIMSFRNSFMRGHIASIAEIWDGDAPHFPKGAPAQAWSVAALYNVESFLQTLGGES